MRIVFMGTPDFAVPCLERLIESKHDIVGVFCQPDKPKGRSQVLTAPPIKELALKNDIPVFQPKTLKDGAGVEILKELNPDLVVVTAYGKILPEDFLGYPKYGCINIHGSILPKYRGASPVQWAVLNGDSEAGVTSMQMDAGLDTGDMLLVGKIPVDENETAEGLFDKLSVLGADILEQTIIKLEEGSLVPKKQDDSKANYVGMLSKEMSGIDWSLSAWEVHNKIRGLYSWPGASTVIDGKTLKLHKAKMSDKTGNNIAGSVIESDKKLVVCCGDNKCVELIEIQLEGKKRMNAEDFLRGRKIPVGTVLGK